MDLELGRWSAPDGYRTAGHNLSLEKARPLPPRAPSGRVARDLKFFDHVGLWHPEEGVTPERIRVAFREAERGYPEMQVRLNKGLREGDAHTRSLFDKRSDAVASKPTVYIPGDNSESSAAGARVLEIAMERINVAGALGHLCQHVADGYAGLEIEWGTMRVDGRLWVVPVDLILVQSERFRVGAQGMLDPVTGKPVRLDELRIFNDLARPQGDELEPGKWVVVRYGSDPLARSGLSRTAAPLLMGKRYAFRDWLILSERFGIPMPIAKYEERVEEWAKEVCRRMVENLGSDGGAVVPEGISLEITKGVEVDKALQGPLIEFCNRELSKLVNGSTDATDGSEGGSYARAAVHGEVRFESVRADASKVHAALDQCLAKPFAQWNGIAVPPKMRQQIARDFSPQALVSLAGKIKNELGVDVSKQQIYEETGVRPPIDESDKAPGAPAPKDGIKPKPDQKELDE